jgi:hypothetical protein
MAINFLNSAYKMRIYSIYLNPKAKKIYENAILVSENFNIIAFFFTGFWALFNRMLIVGIGLLVAQYGTLIFAKYCGVSTGGGIIIDLGIRFLIGLCSNDLLRLHYGNKGYVLSDVVVAHNDLEAFHRYYDRHIKQMGVNNSGAA